MTEKQKESDDQNKSKDKDAAGVQQSGNSSEELDFTGDEAKSEEAIPEVSAHDYDSRPIEDNARRRIAYSLIGLLWLVVVAMLLMLYFKIIVVADIKDFSVVLGPIVTLVSAATGFYYGTKSVK